MSRKRGHEDSDEDYGRKKKKKNAGKAKKIKEEEVEYVDSEEEQEPVRTSGTSIVIPKKVWNVDEGEEMVFEDNEEDEDFLDDDDSDDGRRRRKVKTKVPRKAKKPPANPEALSLAMAESNEVFDYSNMRLKEDHVERPLWVTADMHVFLETFNKRYRMAYDFLIAIAEPVCRPRLIHEYVITGYSLYAAVSVGLETEQIISVLNALSKVALPSRLEEFVRESTMNYGKVKIVLKENRFALEAADPFILEQLLKDKTIEEAREKEGGQAPVLNKSTISTSIRIPGTSIGAARVQADHPPAAGASAGAPAAAGGAAAPPAESAMPGLVEGNAAVAQKPAVEAEMDNDDADVEQRTEVHSFQINPEKIEDVRRQCLTLEYPTLEEYDFRNDHVNPNLVIDLKPSTTLRNYQEKSLSKMFGNGRARSGIIVLPCGAGKTLVGVTACSTIKKSCLVLCTSGVSVEQWKKQFLMWSTVDDAAVSRFSADSKEVSTSARVSGITVSTYSMIAHTGKRSLEAQHVMKQITSHEWGLIILDEVHVVPAQMFRRVCGIIKAHCKLGLTATLVREDDLIGDLNFLIGPKLYEANWLELQAKGQIARVQCAEVWCPMTKEYYREYLKEQTRKKSLLFVMNPNKFHACEFLIKYHEARGDKIIVFSDNVFALIEYATRLGKPYIYGGTSAAERLNVLFQFQHNAILNTIFLSKVGDTSFDLPEASVIIQISSHYGSRRQEAQRLGRILRQKPNASQQNLHEFNAFFYTLVSRDTSETYYSAKRQQFLVDQGYAFKIVSELPGVSEAVLFKDKKEQLLMLEKCLREDVSAAEQEDLDDEGMFRDSTSKNKNRPKAVRASGSMKKLTGADSEVYMDYQRVNAPYRPQTNSVFDRPVQRSKAFSQRYNKK